MHLRMDAPLKLVSLRPLKLKFYFKIFFVGDETRNENTFLSLQDVSRKYTVVISNKVLVVFQNFCS